MYYDPQSFCPRFTVQEAIDLGYLPPDIIDRLPDHPRAIFILSLEAIQDMKINNQLLYTVRTPPITEEEIAAWEEAGRWLDSETIDARKARLESIKPERGAMGFVIEANPPAEEYFEWPPWGESH